MHRCVNQLLRQVDWQTVNLNVHLGHVILVTTQTRTHNNIKIMSSLPSALVPEEGSTKTQNAE